MYAIVKLLSSDLQKLIINNNLDNFTLIEELAIIIYNVAFFKYMKCAQSQMARLISLLSYT